MKKNKQLVPKRRFKEFENDGEWEKYKLEDLVQVNSGRDYKHLLPGNIPVYGTGGYMVSVDEALSSSTDAIGIGRKGTIDRPYLIEAPFWTVDTLFYATAKENNNLYFMLNAFKNISWNAQQETSGVPSLTRIAINNVEVFVPKDEEQEKIGLFFKKIDRVIQKQHLKINKIKVIKESYLSDMFPKEGEKYPKKRFEGFTEPWESNKVGDICNISTGKSNTQDNVQEGKYPFFVRSPIIERSDRYLYDEEAVLTVGDGVGTGKVYHYVNGKYDLHQRVYRMYAFKTGLSGKYFYHYFSNHFYNRVSAMTAKTSVDSVRHKMISEMDIRIPSEKEQAKIVAHLDMLDKLIFQNKHKLTKLEQLKQAYLNELFV